MESERERGRRERVRERQIRMVGGKDWGSTETIYVYMHSPTLAKLASMA